ncbi:heavy metal translocating P-type ATPase [Mogibacterium kristiansenii]|uniref:heavy metal translocating P-type ATPase n=1 Tax=Mogibacterium kristiansenii TaxID=2606708 RepID=UPI002409950A|nr:heavy metal translocating P-type ATPase [Mogibacterium kristiansenii]MDD6700866.1 heavy metal translocating P-type ATPase [Mogibacterium kristiansenii]
MEQYIVTGMTCAACQAHVEKAVSGVPGVDRVNVSLLTHSMTVEGAAAPESVISAVQNAGYDAELKKESAGQGRPGMTERFQAEEDALRDRETPKLLRRLKLSIGVLLVLMYITMGHNMLDWPVPEFLNHNHIGLGILQMLLALIIMTINRDFFRSGFKSLRHGAPNMDTLVALGSGVSFLWSLFILLKMTYMITDSTDNMALMPLYHNQLYFESAAMILALITIGKTLESISKGRTTDALKNLLQMAPKTALLERNGELQEVPVDSVQIGDIYIVKSGDAIPVDGVVLEGTAAVDESPLTGESVPVDKAPGDSTSAATISQSGYLRCRAARVGEDTTFAQIIRLVSDAAGTKAPIARIADKVSGIFVPAVIGIAVLVFALWMLQGAAVSRALEHAITVLVISCPCALGLATPVAIMVGNGMGARNGILFKTSESLENAGKINIIALDKTGTITEGRPKVTDLLPAEEISEETLLKYAAALEERSEHPLGKAIVEYAGEKAGETEVKDFRVLPGDGLQGSVDGGTIVGGSEKFIRSRISVPEEFTKASARLAASGKTPIYFTRNNEILGIIAVADTVREDSREAIAQLRNMGVEVVMLTGDNRNTAEAIGRDAGVKHVIAGVLPEGKEQVIRRLQEHGTVAMVGDGINDAPALTRADIGIAIGAGTDVAVDSAEVVLMNSRLSDVAAAVRLSRATLRNIHENLFWAFAYNILLIPMAAGLYSGISLNPMWGAAAMSLSSFTVCMNALRLNRFRMQDAGKDRPLRKRATSMEEIEYEMESLLKSNETEEEKKMTTEVKIKGMMCAHCEAHVKKALEALDGVESAAPDKDAGNAVLTLSKDVSADAVKAAVEDAGYEFLGMTE